MKVLAAILLMSACDQPAHEVRSVARRAEPRPVITPGDMDSMKDFVRVVEPGAPATDDVPITASTLQPWLIAGSYRAWSHESVRHPSSGPHADGVLTYLSPSLEESLRAKAKAHPRGAAAVKELFDKGGKHIGWAVSVKTAADSADGKNWYWYEVLSTAPTAKAPYQGNGVMLCRDCHTESGGVDQVLIDFPLR